MTTSTPKNRRPIAPGEILREDFIEPLGMPQGRLAEALGIDRTSLNEVVNGRRAVTPAMALRFAHAFGTTPQYWLNAQQAVDLYDALHSSVAKEIEALQVLVAG